MAHPTDLIARVKALMLLGLSAKVAASFAGVPHETAKAWRSGKRSKRVPPDMSIKESFDVLVRGGIVGRQMGHEKICSPAEGARQHGNHPAAPEATPGNSPKSGTSTEC